MANYIVTPNMNLPNPVPSGDPGPDYANNLSSSLNQIDQHNHSAGQGVQIQPNGINISSDLPFNGNNAISLNSVRFNSLLSPLTNSAPNVGCLYVSGNELFYNDYTGGNQVQITVNGLINATSSGISSGTATASFSAGILVVKSSSTSFANIDMQSAVLSNSGNLTNQLTLLAPTLSSSYDLTLPTVPAQTNIMTLDTGGVMGSITYNAVLAASTNANLPGNTVQENGKNVVVSNTNTTASLAIVRASFNSSGTLVAGEGASVSSHPGTGTYIISFTTAFADTPAVVAITAGSSQSVANCNTTTTTGTDIFLVNSNTGAAVNDAFSIIAIGQRT